MHSLNFLRYVSLTLILSLQISTTALAADPKAAPGKPSGGTSIAVLSTGIDYTQPDIAAHLARDGEGELIAWDFAENDRTPYAVSPNSTPKNWGGDGTAFAKELIAAAASAPTKISILPLRIDPGKLVTLGQALAFLTRTPAQLVIVPMWSENAADWEAFKAAAALFKDLKILIPKCNVKSGAYSYPLALSLANVTSETDPETAWLDEPLAKLCE